MIAPTLTRPLTAVPVPDSVSLLQVPARIARRAELRGWPTCDVCRWPVHPAAVVPGRTPRHPGCVCCGCGAPLLAGQLAPGVVWHPQCRPTRATPATARPALTVIGGVR